LDTLVEEVGGLDAAVDVFDDVHALFEVSLWEVVLKLVNCVWYVL
jgi:hypothetical protein